MFCRRERPRPSSNCVNRHSQRGSTTLATGWRDEADSNTIATWPRSTGTSPTTIASNSPRIGDDAKADRLSHGYNYATPTAQRRGQLDRHCGDHQRLPATTAASSDAQVHRQPDRRPDRHRPDRPDAKSTTPTSSPATSRRCCRSRHRSTTALLASTYANPQRGHRQHHAEWLRDEVKSNRLDLEYKLGTHTLRAGLDHNKMSSINAGEARPAAAPGPTCTAAEHRRPCRHRRRRHRAVRSRPAAATGTQGYYVAAAIVLDRIDAYVDQIAQYLEDHWQVTKNLLVTGGMRREGSRTATGTTTTFLEDEEPDSRHASPRRGT